MREIVTVEQVERLFLFLAIALPLAGILIGALWGARKGAPVRGTLAGLLIGLLGPVNWLAWRVYNALTDRMGLDSVKNLLVNLVLFIGVGAVAGLVYGYVARRRGGDAGAPVVVGAKPGDADSRAQKP